MLMLMLMLVLVLVLVLVLMIMLMLMLMLMIMLILVLMLMSMSMLINVNGNVNVNVNMNVNVVVIVTVGCVPDLEDFQFSKLKSRFFLLSSDSFGNSCVFIFFEIRTCDLLSAIWKNVDDGIAISMPAILSALVTH